MTKPLIIDMINKGDDLEYMIEDLQKTSSMNVVLPTGAEFITTEKGFNEIEKQLGHDKKNYLIQCGIGGDTLRIPLVLLGRIGIKKDDRAMITINDDLDKTITISKKV